MSWEEVEFRNDFFFRRRNGKLDWRKLANVDLERVVSTVDVATLQDNVEHITFADVGEDDLRYFTDANFMQLFRLTQLIIEYLINVQNFLLDCGNEKDKRNAELLAAHQAMQDKCKLKDDKIRKLRSELKYARKVIRAYERTGGAPFAGVAPSSEETTNPGQQTADGFHRCHLCRAVFMKNCYLQNHIRRRHPDEPPPIHNTATPIDTNTSEAPKSKDLEPKGPTLDAPPQANTDEVLQRWQSNLENYMETKLFKLLEVYKRKEHEQLISRLGSVESTVTDFIKAQTPVQTETVASQSRIGPLQDGHDDKPSEPTKPQDKLKQLETEQKKLSNMLKDDMLNKLDWVVNSVKEMRTSGMSRHGDDPEGSSSSSSNSSSSSSSSSAEVTSSDEDNASEGYDEDIKQRLKKVILKSDPKYKLFPDMPWLKSRFPMSTDAINRQLKHFDNLSKAFTEKQYIKLKETIDRQGLASQLQAMEKRLENIKNEHFRPNAQLSNLEKMARNSSPTPVDTAKTSTANHANDRSSSSNSSSTESSSESEESDQTQGSSEEDTPRQNTRVNRTSGNNSGRSTRKTSNASSRHSSNQNSRAASRSRSKSRSSRNSSRSQDRYRRRPSTTTEETDETDQATSAAATTTTDSGGEDMKKHRRPPPESTTEEFSSESESQANTSFNEQTDREKRSRTKREQGSSAESQSGNDEQQGQGGFMVQQVPKKTIESSSIEDDDIEEIEIEPQRSFGGSRQAGASQAASVGQEDQVQFLGRQEDSDSDDGDNKAQWGGRTITPSKGSFFFRTQSEPQRDAVEEDDDIEEEALSS